jgi:membrane protein DedA with SNARE-associated domain
MPPTWLVLAFFYINSDVSLLPLVLIGGTSATLGRIILYYLSRGFLRKRIPQKYLENYDDLGSFFVKHEKLTIPVILAYALLPIPSNQVFIVAGLSRMDIRLVSSCFFASRLISYTVWVSAAHLASNHLDTIFSSHFSNSGTFLVEIVGIIGILIIGKIKWRKILKMSN